MRALMLATFLCHLFFFACFNAGSADIYRVEWEERPIEDCLRAVELGKVMVTRTSDKDDSETTEVHAVYKEELFYFLISYSSGASVSGCKGIIFNLE